MEVWSNVACSHETVLWQVWHAGRESRRHVIRIIRRVVVRHVAQVAGAARQVVVVVHVALRALQVRVPVGQRETHRIVVEACGLPGRRVVAGLAGRGEIGGHMVRVAGLLIIRHMAAAARRRRTFELIVDVAGVARERGMRAGQRVSRELQVIEVDPEPVVEAVALFAGGGESSRHVVGAGGRLKLLRVAGIARGGKPLELPDRGALVAGVAIQRGVRAHQGESVLVVLDLLDGNLPSLDGVALFAGWNRTGACECRHGNRRTWCSHC